MVAILSRPQWVNNLIVHPACHLVWPLSLQNEPSCSLLGAKCLVTYPYITLYWTGDELWGHTTMPRSLFKARKRSPFLWPNLLRISANISRERPTWWLDGENRDNMGNMMTSWHRNAYSIPGHLWWEFTVHRWIPFTMGPVMWSFDVFLVVSMN